MADGNFVRVADVAGAVLLVEAQIRENKYIPIRDPCGDEAGIRHIKDRCLFMAGSGLMAKSALFPRAQLGRHVDQAAAERAVVYPGADGNLGEVLFYSQRVPQKHGGTEQIPLNLHTEMVLIILVLLYKHRHITAAAGAFPGVPH